MNKSNCYLSEGSCSGNCDKCNEADVALQQLLSLEDESLESENLHSGAIKRIDGNQKNTSKKRTINGVTRGDIYYADLSPVIGSEQGGIRPVLVIQNDVGNKHSPTTIVAAITSQMSKAKLPTHVGIPYSDNGLSKNSVALLEQVRTIDKRRLREKICSVDDYIMSKVDKAIIISLGV